jgi:hypothetical protein
MITAAFRPDCGSFIETQTLLHRISPVLIRVGSAVADKERIDALENFRHGFSLRGLLGDRSETSGRRACSSNCNCSRKSFRASCGFEF